MPRHSIHEMPEEVIARYREGETLKQIGERYSVSSMSVMRLLKSYEIPLRPPGRRRHLTLTERKCWKCQTVKDACEFNRSMRQYSGLDPTCKSCHRTLGRRHSLKTTYGINVERYEEMMSEQGGCCAICNKPESSVRSGRIKYLSVDHCHKSGLVRGLLCQRCNAAIGLLNDDALLLRNAAKYVSGS